MADFVFTVALGRARTYAELPAAADSLIVVLLKASGIEADSVLRDYDTLAALLAAANDEADFTGYSRKTLSGLTITEDETNNRVDIDAADISWNPAGGATNNTLGRALVCYKPDTGSADSAIIPLSAHAFVATTDGNELIASIAVGGFYRGQG